MNVDRYITDEVLRTAHAVYAEDGTLSEIFRAALPHILTQHRAQCRAAAFREAARIWADEPGSVPRGQVAAVLHRMAHEAVAE